MMTRVMRHQCDENTETAAGAARHRPLVVLKCKIENSNLKLSLTPRKQILDGKSLGVCSKTPLVQNQLYLASKPINNIVNARKYKLKQLLL